MAKITLPYTIINGDPVDAGPVEGNYQTIEHHTNQELIERGGTVAMVAQLKLVGNPVAPLDAAPKQYVDQMLPIGIITMFGGVAAPPGGVWLKCDNTEYQVADYPALAAVLNNAVSGRFRVPDLTDRFPVGGGGAYPNLSTGGTADAVVPLHTHPIDHDIPALTTGDDAPDHGHPGPPHQHGMSFTTATDGTHYHVPESPNAHGGFIVDGDGQPGVPGGPDLITGGGSYAFANRTALPTGAPGPAHGIHAHGVNGATNATDAYTIGGANARHHHVTPAFSVVATSGQASAGVDPIGKNTPKYTAVTFIIRAA